jgi:hypothetical protein
MPTERTPGLAALDVFVGRWTLRAQVPDEWQIPAPPDGYVEFSWALDGRFLLQHSAVPDTPFPSTMAIVAPDGDGYRQHYFDSRGVVRLYRMTLRDGVWTLERTAADFSPLNFAQRFIGTFGPDRTTIDGRWEQSQDAGTTWELDFGLTYTRDR